MSQSSEAMRRFVHDTGLLLENAGLPRMAGQILGWMLVCEPEHQSLNDLTEVLGVSKASISTTTRLLEQVGLLERIFRPGDRRDYYRVSDDAWKKFMRTRLETMRRMRQTAETGLRLLADSAPQRRERLGRMHQLFGFLEREMGQLFERFEAEQTPAANGAADFARNGGAP